MRLCGLLVDNLWLWVVQLACPCLLPAPATTGSAAAHAGAATAGEGDSSSADERRPRPQFFIRQHRNSDSDRNSDSSATSGDDSSDDSSFDSSGAGAESAGDSPQGKSGVVQSRLRDGGGFVFYPTRHAPPAVVSHRTRETERDARKLNGECSVVGGPSGVSTGRQSQGPLRRDFRDSSKARPGTVN